MTTTGSVLTWAGFEQPCGDRALCLAINPLSLRVGELLAHRRMAEDEYD